MSGAEQVFFLVVVPAAIVAVVWALASIGGLKAQRRYRPGRSHDFTTVWYVANHRHGPRTDRQLAVAGGRELTPAGRESTTGQAAQGTTGGASDRW